jgi:transposase
VPHRIPVPLELDDFEVLGAEVVGKSLEIHVVSTSPRVCHHCGSVDVLGHGRRQRRIRDQAFGRPTVLIWSQRRFRCRDCGRTSRERHPEITRGRSVTQRFRKRLFERACYQPFSVVADEELVSNYRVVDSFDAHAASEVARRHEPLRVISLDESSFRRRFRFHTILCNPEKPAVMEMVEGRDERAAEEAISKLDPQVRAGIETVVIDCHWPYRRAVESLLPDVRIVADKFHVVRAVDEAAQKVRRRFGRRPHERRVGRDGGVARQNHPASDPVVFRGRWVFMRLLKEAFASIYESSTREEAEQRLDVWISNVGASGLAEFINLWRTLNNWREQILAYFDDPMTNAFAEGITNKIKVIKRMSYGFRDPIRYRHKVLVGCRRRTRSHQESG